MERQFCPQRLINGVIGSTPEQFGAWAEETNLTYEEREDFLWWIRNGWKYRERPVSVDDFLDSRTHLKAVDASGESIYYPEVKAVVQDVCRMDRTYVEAVLTGGIGVGKTSAALAIMAYEIYHLLCMWNPHAVFDLDPASEIVFVFQSLTEKAATDVDYTRLRRRLNMAPIFQDPYFRFNPDIKSRMEFPMSIVCQPVAGVEEAGLGQNIFGGILEEIAAMAVVEKSKRSRDEGVYDQAVKLYQAISRRRESRFMNQGQMPGMLCLVGSKKYPDDFLHQKLDEARDRPGRIKVYDKKIWEVKPWSFGGKTFPVFVGDVTRKPRLIAPGDGVAAEDEDLMLDVPVELRHQFEDDLLEALRDCAGISILSIHPLMLNRDAIGEAFGRVLSVASRPDVDFRATELSLYPKRWAGTEAYPRYVHLDLALSGDSAGLAIGHVAHFKRIKRSQMVDEILPIITFDMLLEIRPPRGGEIVFDKIRRLLYLLREHGMPLKWVSADGWQSIDMLQILSAKGMLVGQESPDKNPGIYDVTKSAIYDGRFWAPKHPKAMAEFTRLERDPKTGKIDHPQHGSKDVSDAAACVVFGLSLQAEVWTQFNIDLRHVPDTLFEAAAKESKNDMEGKM